MSLQFIHVRGILHFPDLRTSACTFVQFPPKLFLTTSVTIFLSHFLFLCFCPYHYHPVQWLFMFFSCRKKHKLKETQPESSFSSEEFVRAYHSCLLWPLPRKWVVYIANVPFQASVIILGNSIIITWHIIISSRDNVLLRKTPDYPYPWRRKKQRGPRSLYNEFDLSVTETRWREQETFCGLESHLPGLTLSAQKTNRLLINACKINNSLIYLFICKVYTNIDGNNKVNCLYKMETKWKKSCSYCPFSLQGVGRWETLGTR